MVHNRRLGGPKIRPWLNPLLRIMLMASANLSATVFTGSSLRAIGIAQATRRGQVHPKCAKTSWLNPVLTAMVIARVIPRATDLTGSRLGQR